MSFLHTANVEIKGIAACVPATHEQNTSLNIFNGEDSQNFFKTTGVGARYIAGRSVCTSDLCVAAAKKLLNELNWLPEEVEGLIFVTQTPDYILPATSPSIQLQLGLPETCFTLDISLGCSGFVYGLSTLAAYMQAGGIKKALLLTGDTISRICSPEDKSTYPLFGDAGTATALEFKSGAEGFKFHLASDGSGKDAIIIKDGGYRNQYNETSTTKQIIADGICRSNLDLALDGMDVFSFGITKAPQSVNLLLDKFQLQKEVIDLFFFHQANMMMNEKIRKKLELPVEKVPYSLKDFGNTSSATIPLTMVTQTASKLKTETCNIVACGFGVGLSWGSVFFKTENLVIPDLIFYE
jgi:3-oxoacyl-[acyl-carrier-protein] synthase III